MKALLAFSRAVDWLNEHLGRLVYWLVLVVALLTFVFLIDRV